MKLLLAVSNALNKWLKSDLPRLESVAGQQVGVNPLSSNKQVFSWQLHIIDNYYRSFEKTIIATEAYSRFTCFIPVTSLFTLEALEDRLLLEWQMVLAETTECTGGLASSDIAYLLYELEQMNFNVEWVKNTNLSINGHITDAGLWVTQTLKDKNIECLPEELAIDVAVYLNSQTKRINSRKEKFVPIERMLTYCRQLPPEQGGVDDEYLQPIPNNVVQFKRINR
ncbi:amino acid adenylation [Colwellia sp. MB3u-70]|uniref:amino acid adenylation n=1 Tax=unclassified Colwellia TaxID=196834 RepID=UPI0015F467B5|nr:MULTISPECIES: amino acid adenylation [unclassified Colwellia]MBA6291435.1 amino acid adenylation [Colwellia sp. MB3u-8]MBA6305872.1 amino acid adenylation [Colwellia sp. MB3u-70]